MTSSLRMLASLRSLQSPSCWQMAPRWARIAMSAWACITLPLMLAAFSIRRGRKEDAHWINSTSLLVLHAIVLALLLLPYALVCRRFLWSREKQYVWAIRDRTDLLLTIAFLVF